VSGASTGPYGHHSNADIYFIQAVEGGLIKIGSSRDPAHRLKALQAACPIRLRLIGVIRDAGWKREHELHSSFWAMHAYGEWFQPEPALIAYIAKHATEVVMPPERSRSEAERAADLIRVGKEEAEAS
jgi:hypothetical protein